MDKWDATVGIRKLINAGVVAPITCPDCNFAIVFLTGDDEEPITFCPACGQKTDPGTGFWNDIESAIERHKDV